MTITLNTQVNGTTGDTECISLTVVSTVLDDWMANQGTKTLTAELSINCGETTYTKTIEVGDVSGDGGATPYSFDLIPSDYESTESTLNGGVHKVKLVLTTNATGSTEVEVGCKVVNCDLLCEVRDFMAANENSTIWMWYNALIEGEQCDQCSCQETCSIWDYLQEELLNNTSTDDCGC